ncbi:MAG: DegT/DnrJ/EryC1/StrS family aminotransferase [Pyrinomonadaceae bacterium]
MSLKHFLKSKERAYPRVVGLLRRAGRRLNPDRSNYPRIMGREIAAVAGVLRTPNWNMNYGGDLVHVRLEEEFAAYVGTRYAVAVNTGGMALQMALRVFGVKPGDEVIHQVDTCVADAFAVMAAGGTPIFADINKDNFMLCGESVARQVNEQTKALIAIHMWGNLEAMDQLTAAAERRKLYVLEDACLALGATWNGRRAGSLSDAGVFSLGCLKPIQAGEGGIITTDDEAFARELRTIRNWGDMSQEYGVRDQQTLSWNGRISEIVAAVALEQLRGYPAYLERLRELVAGFTFELKRFAGIEIAVPESERFRPAYSQIVVRLDEKLLGISKTELMRRLQEQGVGVWHANFEPINQLSFFRKGGWREWVVRGNTERVQHNYDESFPNAQEVYDNLGMGFSKDNFASKERVKRLVKALDQALKG